MPTQCLRTLEHVLLVMYEQFFLACMGMPPAVRVCVCAYISCRMSVPFCRPNSFK